MSELDYVQSNFLLNAAPASEELLDASSLNTVLSMLEVIDSVEELALLETLTLAQKRQVWDATPNATRSRLKQLKTAESDQHLDQYPDQNSALPTLELPTLENSSTPPQLTDALEPLEEAANSAEEPQEETQLTDLEAQLDEMDLRLQEPLNLAVQPTLVIGDWIVLHAKPKLSRSELMAIWEVIEVRGNSARIFTEGLGTRVYPTAWMQVYPKPVDYVEPEF